MKIAVCIKRVPDSETRVKIASDGKSLDEAGVKFILNPYDEFAVEEALRRKEQAGAGEVVVVALGPAAAQETIRTALAMGADRGVLLQVDRIPADGLEAAKALAAELKRSEEHTSELQSRLHLVCRLLLEKKKKNNKKRTSQGQNRHTATIQRS